MLTKIKQRLFLLTVFFFMFLISCDKDDDPQMPPKNPDKTTLLKLVNDIRSKGCNCGDEYYPPAPEVRWSDILVLAAKDHSNDMNKNIFFSHTGSDGSNAGERIKRHNYIWASYGENIAKGQKTEEQVVNDWINSPTHCKNIMKADFTEMGVATSGLYWTQLFARQ